jgi:pimeloyl-ACP methyl ester carboxylesterase
MTPTSSFLHANGLQFHLVDWGGAGNPPLILLHGLASTLHMFDLIAPALAERWHTIGVDQRGHGLSDKPSDGYDFDSIARDLDGILDALGFAGQPVMLAGHSWGAYTALYYAATRPARVAKAVLIDGGIRRIGDSYATWEEAEIGMSPPRYVNRSVEDIRRLIREDWLGAMLRPELEPLAFSIYDTGNPADVQPRLSRANHLQIAHALWAFNPDDYYARIKCPTLIIAACGDAPDPATERYADEAVRRIPHAELVWMRDTAHDIPWHRPAELTRLIGLFASTQTEK